MNEPALLDRDLLRQFPLPHHPEDADKDDRGVALLIAGSREFTGAALLAGIGALRAGAGKLRIATTASIARGIGVAIPEAGVIAFAEGSDGCIDQGAIDGLIARCTHMSSLTVGPGLQEGHPLTLLLERLLDTMGSHPLVLDAAALSLLPPLAAKLCAWPDGTVLLPHGGELARLLGRDRDKIDADRETAARQAADTFGAHVVAKGAPSIIAVPDGRVFRFPGGGVGLATSGSGDVLAGIVGGLAARGADPLTAALWGVYLHGESGRLLSQRMGRVGFLARELLDHVPRLMEECSSVSNSSPQPSPART